MSASVTGSSTGRQESPGQPQPGQAVGVTFHGAGRHVLVRFEDNLYRTLQPPSSIGGGRLEDVLKLVH